MNTELEKSVIFESDMQKAKLQEWSEYIGESRYLSVLKFIKEETNIDNVSYKEMVEYAKYDFKLADVIFSVIKFVEYHLRAAISNNYGDKKITKEHYLYEISELFTNGEKKLPCDTMYDRHINNKCTMDEYLDNSNLNAIIRLFLCLPDDMLSKFEFEGRDLKNDLETIKNIRNDIAHGKTLIGSKVNLSEELITIFLYIPSQHIKERFLRQLKEIYDSLSGAISESKLLHHASIDISTLIESVTVK